MNTIFNFDFPLYKVSKRIRLIELFGGIGCQAQALKNIGANFEHYKLVENNKNAVISYNTIHGTSFVASDIRKLSGGGIHT